MEDIIFFTKYDYAGASSRYRAYQYFPFFNNAGFNVKVEPFFTAEYLQNKYAGQSVSKYYLLKCYLRRIKAVLSLSRDKKVYVEYEFLPYFPAILVKWLKLRKIEYVVDYDDAIFHNYDKHPNSIIRKVLSGKIPSVISNANSVITGSEYLTSFAKKFNKNVVEIPTSIDIEKYKAAQPINKITNRFTIGWIGSPSNSKNVVKILPALKEFLNNYSSRLLLVGFDKSMSGYFEGLPVEVVQWTENDEIGWIKSFDVGIMPLDNTPFNNGKCGFKLIQYMACGVPTISTPLQANININRNGLNLFATDNNEWLSAFEKIYIEQSYYCNIVGQSNIEVVEEHYSIQANQKTLINIFKNQDKK